MFHEIFYFYAHNIKWLELYITVPFIVKNIGGNSAQRLINVDWLFVGFYAQRINVTWLFGVLTHWDRVMHICVSKVTTIGSDNGLSPGQHLAILWTNAGILLVGPLKINFSANLIKIDTISFKKMHLNMSFGKWQPFCLSLNVLTHCGLVTPHGNRDLGQHWLR